MSITPKDYNPSVSKPEIEDLLRDTLLKIIKEEYDKDLSEVTQNHAKRPLVNILQSELDNFSKYQLVKKYINWTKTHTADDLTDDEKARWVELFEKINKILK